jgi:galactosamine-6-phosphate isomerase
MKIVRLDSYQSLSREASSLILKELERNRNTFLCAATGKSPEGIYALLKQAFDLQPALFSGLRVIKLDEWGGVPMDSTGTCESFLKHHLVGPLRIDSSRYISFQSNPKDPVRECNRIQDELKKSGPIDISILGLGMNGHLALNEPGEFVEAGVHVARLSETSLTHSMIKDMKIKPSFGLTLGMADILQSRFIVLLISGNKKKKVTAELLRGKISTTLPASLLWLHPNVVCLINQNNQ